MTQNPKSYRDRILDEHLECSASVVVAVVEHVQGVGGGVVAACSEAAVVG